MLDDTTTSTDSSTDQTAASNGTPTRRTSRRAASRPAGPPVTDSGASDPTNPTNPTEPAPAKKTPAKRTTAKKAPAKKTTAKKAAAKETVAKKSVARKTTAKNAEAPEPTQPAEPVAEASRSPESTTLFSASPKAQPRRRVTREAAAPDPTTSPERPAAEPEPSTSPSGAPLVALFQPPDVTAAQPTRRRRATKPAEDESSTENTAAVTVEAAGAATDVTREDEADDEQGDGARRRRRRRGGRRRRKAGSASDEDMPRDGAAESDGETDRADTHSDDHEPTDDDHEPTAEHHEPTDDDASEEGESASTRRRRRRRRRGEDDGPAPDDPANTVVRVRDRKSVEDEITSVSGSTRLEAKKQRRREGREAGRRRAPIVSEAEFLARREAVKREMVIRQRGDLTQIAVVEDGVLVEHYVARESQTSMLGNVYLGRVQNVLPSMEAAFVDIGKGRNAVLYAGEVDWKALGGEGKPRKIEEVLKSGQTVLVQVTKDPVGHKGARLTSQISLPGRFLVYVPNGHTSGISRKLPDTERNRLKALLKEILPEEAGVIIRTAAEGATEEQLTRDVGGLTARWADISAKAKSGSAPQLLYGEPDLMIKVVRDLFNEDFVTLAVDGDDAWDMVHAYVDHVAPDLNERIERWSGERDVFSAYRIDEQIAKGLDRKVWLPSGGSLVIDRTEAMTVVDVNTGKFTGSGGNLEETVTKNNLEAAEEIVRQIRLRDIGGIIVIDFIDMVLESNRDLVLRRLVECLGRDRTRHQVAEVTSLGLVQMTRKRIGTGLLEAFSETCEHCHGRGLILHEHPIEPKHTEDATPRRGRRDEPGSQTEDTGESAGEPKAAAKKQTAARKKATGKKKAGSKKKAEPPADPTVLTDEVPAS